MDFNNSKYKDEYNKGYKLGYNTGYEKGKADVIEEIKKVLHIFSHNAEAQIQIKYDGKTATDWIREDMCKHCIHSANGVCLWQGPEPCMNFNQWRYIGND